MTGVKCFPRAFAPLRPPKFDEAFYVSLVTEALQLDNAIAAILGTPPPPAPDMPTPARAAPPQQRTGYAPPPQQDMGCRVCGGDLGPVKQTPRGRVRECLQQHGECKNERGYPTSVWLDQAAGGRR